MKKILLLCTICLVLFSCGKEKKTEAEKEVAKTDFVVYLDAIYQKNDSTFLSLYDNNGNDIMAMRVFTNVKGSPLVQRVAYKIKTDVDFSNICFSLSTNKEQGEIQIKGITVMNKDKTIIGAPGDHWDYYFANNDQLEMNVKTGIHKIKHDKEYCAGLAGNETLKSLFEKEKE